MEEQKSKIPAWADRFLSWYCAPDLLEEVRGDLYESFARNLQEIGENRARRRFIWDVVRFFNFSTIQGNRKWKSDKIYFAMITHNLRFLLRRLFKQKLNTTLHITGLTIGLSVCLLIGLFIRHELSFDDYHQKAKRIYRVNQVWEDNGEKELYYGAPAPLVDVLRKEIPEIELVGVAYPLNEKIIEINPQKRFKQSRILMADAPLLDILDFKILKGNSHEALRNPNQALLTESLAEKFFGREDPIGKTFLYENELTVTVAGVIEDLPKNTHLPASMLLSYFPHEPWLLGNKNNWGMTFGASTFVVLKEGVDPASLHSSIRAIYDVHLNTDAEEPEIGYAELQALSQIHLNPEVDGGGKWVKAINPAWLWFFGGISLAVLLLACINFINLSTAEALTRAKEVGVRKAVGAGRGQLLRQFLGEAFLLIIFASILALVVAHSSLPYINNLIEKNISPAILASPGGLAILMLFILLVGFLTGIYPAWLIAKFQPAEAMKTSISSSDKKSNFLRKGLVVTQFTISGALLVALLIMSRQMDYFHQKNLGFDKENIITVPMPDVKKNEVFKTSLASISQIENISFAMAAPASNNTWTTVMHETNLNDPNRKEVRIIWADENYDDIYDLELLAGRFTENKDTNSISQNIPQAERFPRVIVNESLVKEMGFGAPEAALHQRFLIGHNDWKAEVVGVIADFNIASLHQAIQPLLISPQERFQSEASIKLKPGEGLPKTLASVKSSWEEIFPNHIYDFKFLEKTIERYYESESRLYGLFKIFASLAMLISCLGLWGLATFATTRRTKEIGIRKVFGASVSGLVALLSRDFLLLVGIALLIAIPIAWYSMNAWLQNFAFRIDIQWPVFVLSALLVVSIALITVSFQAIRAALANPIRSLRNE